MCISSRSQRLANPSPNNIIISKRQNAWLLSLVRTSRRITFVYNGRVNGDMISNVFKFAYAVLDKIDISLNVRCEYIATSIIATCKSSPGLLPGLINMIEGRIPINISDGVFTRSNSVDEISGFAMDNITKESLIIFRKITTWHHIDNKNTAELIDCAIEFLSLVYRDKKYVVNYLYNYIQTHITDGSPTSDKIKFMFMKAELESVMNI